MSDPITPSARFVLKQSLEELAAAVDGVPAEALNWKPAADDANSIAGLALHALHATRSWLAVAVAGEVPTEADRAWEFVATEDDPGEVLRLVEEQSEQCITLLSEAGEVDWSASRKIGMLSWDTTVDSVPAAWALLHALEHLGQHVAHCSLTRQLWESRVEAAR